MTRYKVRITDTVMEEYSYIVEADDEYDAQGEAEQMHCSNPDDADYSWVPERDFDVEEVKG